MALSKTVLQRSQRVVQLSTRHSSTSSIPPAFNTNAPIVGKVHISQPQVQKVTSNGLHRLPTTQLIRNLFLGAFFTSPLLFRTGFACLRFIANSKSKLWNVDSNRLLNALVKPVLYDQFCAGQDRAAIAKTRTAITSTGYSGIILCYGKEMDIKDAANAQTADVTKGEIKHWRSGNLETLDMIDAGNWLGIKMTGAGSEVLRALKENKPIPPEFAQAMADVCEQARRQDCRLYIDSEQDAVQQGIDNWTIDLMRRYNRNGQTLVYNTLQSYLKTCRTKLQRQLHLAATEGWQLGIKLVRGAYIAGDPRHLIHDTKQDTDDSYNGIVSDVLAGRGFGFPPAAFPPVRLLLAGHNPQSINAALQTIQSLRAQGRLKVVPEFAQLQGMGDYIGCDFLQQCADMQTQDSGVALGEEAVVPKMYKCLTWGTVGECMQYLVRRAVENQGGTERMRDGMAAYWGEIKRRMFGARAGM